MNAFATAMAALYADPNLAVAVSYTLAAGGPPIAGVPVILSTPDGPGSPAKASVLASALVPYGRPRKGDLLTLDDGRAFKAEDVELDAEGQEWTMRLSTVRA
jgi:hypothetical protein